MSEALYTDTYKPRSNITINPACNKYSKSANLSKVVTYSYELVLTTYEGKVTGNLLK